VATSICCSSFFEATVLVKPSSLPPSAQCQVGTAAWQRVNTQVPIRSPRYAVFDLAEGKEYQFRVLSANMYGTSEPSEPSKLIQTQALKGQLHQLHIF
jgi:hypothetical protein